MELSLDDEIINLLSRKPELSTSPFYELATRLQTGLRNPPKDDVAAETIIALVDLFIIDSYEYPYRQAAGNLLLELVKHSETVRHAIIKHESIREPIAVVILKDSSAVLKTIGALIVDHFQQYHVLSPTRFFPNSSADIARTFPSETGRDWTQAFANWLHHDCAETAEKSEAYDIFYAVGLQAIGGDPLHLIHHDKAGHGTIVCSLEAAQLTCARVAVDPTKSSWYLHVPMHALSKSTPRRQHPVPADRGYPTKLADQVRLEIDEETCDITFNGVIKRAASLLLVLGVGEEAKDISEMFKHAMKTYDSQHDRQKDLRVSTSTMQFNCTIGSDPAEPPATKVDQPVEKRTDKGAAPSQSKQQSTIRLSEPSIEVPASSQEPDQGPPGHDLGETDIVHDSHGFSQDQRESKTASANNTGLTTSKSKSTVKEYDFVTESGKPAANGGRVGEGASKLHKGSSKLRQRMSLEADGKVAKPEYDGAAPRASKKDGKSKPIEDGETQLFFDKDSAQKPRATKTYKTKTAASEKGQPRQQGSKADAQQKRKSQPALQTSKADGQSIKRKTRSSIVLDDGDLTELPPAKRPMTTKARNAASNVIHTYESDDSELGTDLRRQVKKVSSETIDKASRKSQGSVGRSTLGDKKSQLSAIGKAAASSKSATRAGTSPLKQHSEVDVEIPVYPLKNPKAQIIAVRDDEEGDESGSAIAGPFDRNTAPTYNGKLRSVNKSVPKFGQMSNNKSGTQKDKRTGQSKKFSNTQNVEAGKGVSTQPKPEPAVRAARNSQPAPKSSTAAKQPAPSSVKVPVIDLETPKLQVTKPHAIETAPTTQLIDDAANRKAQLVSFSATGPRNQGSRSPRKAPDTAQGIATEPETTLKGPGNVEPFESAGGHRGTFDRSLKQSTNTDIAYDTHQIDVGADAEGFEAAPPSSPAEDLYADRLGSQLSQRVSGEGSPHRKGVRLTVADIRGSVMAGRPAPASASQNMTPAALEHIAVVEAPSPPSRNPDNDVGRWASMPTTAPALKLSHLLPGGRISEEVKDQKSMATLTDANRIFKKPVKPAGKALTSAASQAKPPSQVDAPRSSLATSTRDRDMIGGSARPVSSEFRRAPEPSLAEAEDLYPRAQRPRGGSKLVSQIQAPDWPPENLNRPPQPTGRANTAVRPSIEVEDRPEEAAHAAAKAEAPLTAAEAEVALPSPEASRLMITADQQKHRDILAEPAIMANDEPQAMEVSAEVEQSNLPSSSALDEACEVSRPPPGDMLPQAPAADTAAPRSSPQLDERTAEPGPTPKPEHSLFADFIARKSSQPFAPIEQATGSADAADNVVDPDKTLIGEYPDVVAFEAELAANEHKAECMDVVNEGEDAADAADEDVRMSDHSSDSDARSIMSGAEQQVDAEGPAAEPDEDPALTAYREYMTWEEALDPHQKEYHDIFARISKQLISHILDTETSAISTISDYEKGGSALIAQLKESQAAEAEAYDAQMKQAGTLMRTRMMNLLAELDDGGRYARETTKGLKDWEAGWREETDNATADVERLMEVWA